MQDKILLIVPCYNEARRLDFPAFRKAPTNCYLLFVNDGSTDDTAAVLKENLKENMFILDLKTNKGKAEAVRAGFMHSSGLPVFDSVKWVGFWDADLATPLYEVDNFLTYQKFLYPGAVVICGSRIARLGSHIQRRFSRHILGRFLTTLISISFGLKSYDTQCGAKLFRKELIDKYFSEPFVSNWLFDVEILLRMKGEKIVEYPLAAWVDVPGSKIRPVKTIFEIILTMIRLKIIYPLR